MSLRSYLLGQRFIISFLNFALYREGVVVAQMIIIINLDIPSLALALLRVHKACLRVYRGWSRDANFPGISPNFDLGTTN